MKVIHSLLALKKTRQNSICAMFSNANTLTSKGLCNSDGLSQTLWSAVMTITFKFEIDNLGQIAISLCNLNFLWTAISFSALRLHNLSLLQTDKSNAKAIQAQDS